MPLERIKPDIWLWKLPAPIRWFIFHPFAWFILTWFCSLYYIVPICLLLFPVFYFYFPISATIFLTLAAISAFVPTSEWPAFRNVGQLFYEITEFRINTECWKYLDGAEDRRYILAHFPHGIVPFTAFLWAALCEQIKPEVYGFGAVAPIIEHLPFFRQMAIWLSAGDPRFARIDKELDDRNLWILPEGIAGIFTAKPGRHRIVFKHRRGLCKLAFKHGAGLVPMYAFGTNDAFNQIATDDGFLGRISRKIRIAGTIFWGQYYLPIPFPVKITCVFGEPIFVEKNANPTPEMIEDLHARFCEGMHAIFERYKVEAGYPDGKLEIV